MKLFNIAIQLGRDVGLTKPEEELDLIAKIDEWEKGAKKEDASSFQKLYYKIHKEPILEVLSPFIYILLRQWFNTILNPESEDEYSRRLRD